MEEEFVCILLLHDLQEGLGRGVLTYNGHDEETVEVDLKDDSILPLQTQPPQLGVRLTQH